MLYSPAFSSIFQVLLSFLTYFLRLALAFHFCGTLPAELVCCHAGNDWVYWEVISMWSPRKLLHGWNFKTCCFSVERLQATQLLPQSLVLTSGGYTWVHPGLIDHGWATRLSLGGSSALALTYLHVDTWTKVCEHVHSKREMPSCSVAHRSHRGRLGMFFNNLCFGWCVVLQQQEQEINNFPNGYFWPSGKYVLSLSKTNTKTSCYVNNIQGSAFKKTGLKPRCQKIMNRDLVLLFLNSSITFQLRFSANFPAVPNHSFLCIHMVQQSIESG